MLKIDKFVELKGNDIEHKIPLKAFHSEIINDHAAIRKEEESYKDIPSVREVDAAAIQQNYLQVKGDIGWLIESEMEWTKNDPGLAHLIILEKPGKK
ncbi:MAG: hypothetical protein EPN37_10540 [Chitinophagaceae bacterium]|nr:MAG: hypothetical protein EPN37_10540 [Chitinophagaceae bacterium]